jgi:hypothetical protein
MVSQLLALKARFELQIKDIETFKEIAAESQAMFERGLISAKHVNDDLTASLVAQDALTSMTVEIIALLADASSHLLQSDSFVRLIGQ